MTPQTKTPKIKIVTHQEESGKSWIFAEYYSGMILGAVKQCGGQFGPDPKDVSIRFFLTDEEAITHVKDKCMEYLGRDDVTFLVQDADRTVMPAFNMPPGRRKV